MIIQGQSVGTLVAGETGIKFLTMKLNRAGGDYYMGFDIDVPFDTYGTTPNQRQVGQALMSLDQDSPLFKELVIAMEADESQAPGIQDMLAGAVHASAQGALFILDNSFMRMVSTRLSHDSASADTASGRSSPSAGSPDGITNRIWYSAEATYAKLKGDGNASSAELRGPEFAIGYEAGLVNGWIGGIVLRYMDKELKVESPEQSADIKSLGFGLYGGREFALGSGMMRLLAGAQYSSHDISSNRKVTIGAATQTLEADYDGSTVLAYLEAAYRFKASDRVELEPFMSASRVNMTLDGFVEHGGSAALRKEKDRFGHTMTTLGVRLAAQASSMIEFNAEAAWNHIYGDMTPDSTMSFAAGSPKFTVEGSASNRDEVLLGVGVGARLADNLKLNLGYNTALGSRAVSHSGSLTLNVTF
jgi:outer membrane autotransporter protein